MAKISERLAEGLAEEVDFKRVILIRHGQSTFNAWRRRTFLSWLLCRCCRPRLRLRTFRSDLRDAPLSRRGLQQVQSLNRALELGRFFGGCTLSEVDVELIVVSPLTRAIDTCLGALEGRVPQQTPILVHDVIRERLGSSCDIGTTKSKLQERYAAAIAGRGLVFPEDLPEMWWDAGDESSQLEEDSPLVFEDRRRCAARVKRFRQWIEGRKERTIVVVGHSSFFQILCGDRFKMENCGVRQLAHHFRHATGERRSAAGAPADAATTSDGAGVEMVAISSVSERKSESL